MTLDDTDGITIQNVTNGNVAAGSGMQLPVNLLPGTNTLIFQAVNINGIKSDSIIYTFDVTINDPSDPITYLSLIDGTDMPTGTILQSNVNASFDTTIVLEDCDTMMQFAIAAVDSCGIPLLSTAL